MNKKMLEKLINTTTKELEAIKTKVESDEVTEEELEELNSQVEELTSELKDYKDQLAALEEDDVNEPNTTDPNGDERAGMVSPENRSALLEGISAGLSHRGQHTSNNKSEETIRSAFAQFVVGKITESEARSLGIDVGNGSVTVPTFIANDIITYAQEENPLRRKGEVFKTEGNVEYPILVKKAEANINKKERTKDVEETEIEFDVIKLSPAEFDALATVTKKLLKMSGAPIETIVIEELKKAYVRKEAEYMFNGTTAGNENPGALAKKAVEFTPNVPVDLTSPDAGQQLYDALIEFKNTPVTEVMNKGEFLINRAALQLVEKMKTKDGFPLLRPMAQAENGIGNLLVGFPMEVTDYVDINGDSDTPVLYFGDFKSFKIQDVIGAMEIQKLIEKFSGTNKVGFQIYNLLDGQLVYSPMEPTVYKYVVKPADGNIDG